jgi:hypothetical protein
VDVSTERAPLIEQHVPHIEEENAINRLFLNMLAVGLFVLYFELTERVLSVFSSTRSLDGQLFVTELPWLPFSFSDSSFYSLVVAAVCFGLLYVVGLPVLFALVLKRADRKGFKR